MDCKNKSKYIVIILIPLIIGIIINRVNFILQIYSTIPWIFVIAFIIFWFWAGKVFAKANHNRVESFLIGNSLWGISFLLYIWQFILTSDVNKNFIIAGISQNYIILIVPIATKIMMMFTDIIDGAIISIVSYILMIIIFSIGFIFESVKKNHSLQAKL
ncbi:putative membrane protein [Clostridium argentinense CDC 2741]|uniref:Putative membrane protein n=1 Tax=Clostridium argentinense CDC 2741 TaxID=1418104 RepID=A0A0C1R4U3_9CLOT|nr:hypothetical protein [Clostridium argentinense]ARC86655.1 hypothetical protein RSJ17_20240 [Clostridium argentinense]KIE45521.1 putative membrane protein [Clostridium argentinense CDC 2741]NFF38391.1 hypothetical protein [Clostridium argentinense]NFP49415.1 hypothetical protein [Clostridium argentinense]NFP71818.1 hypothetical protein [Clostridium argentinense]